MKKTRVALAFDVTDLSLKTHSVAVANKAASIYYFNKYNHIIITEYVIVAMFKAQGRRRQEPVNVR